MSRPIGRLACSCWRTFPKNSKLSLMSSTYLTWPQYFLSKDFSTDLSMYSGQLENVQLPIATFGWLTAVEAFLPELSPFTPPQAARNADPGPMSRPAPARWRMNWRRECSLPSSIRSTMPSMSSLRIVFWLLSLHDECVGWVPGERHGPAGTDGVGGVAVSVWRDHGQLAARLRLDHVLDRNPEVARDRDTAMDDIARGGGRLGTGAIGRDRDLLRAHADSNGAALNET